MSGEAADTRPVEAALLREIDGLRQDVRDHRAETKERLQELVEQARATNGRLRRVELWIAGLKAVGVVFVALTPFLLVHYTNFFGG